MLERQEIEATLTDKVKQQLIELLAWLEGPISEGVLEVLIEDSGQCITLLKQLKQELYTQCLANAAVG